MNDPQKLADLIEGLLPDDDAAKLRERIAAEPDLREQYQALQSLFNERAELVEHPVPAGLEDSTLAILEIEGLVQSSGAAFTPTVPEGLITATMARLEDEGLVEARPSRGSRLPALFLMLLGLCLAFSLGWWLKPSAPAGDRVVPLETGPAPSRINESLKLQVKSLEDQIQALRDKESRPPTAKSEMLALQKSNESLREELLQRTEDVAQARKEAEELKSRLSESIKERKAALKSLAELQESADETKRAYKGALARLSSKSLELGRLQKSDAKSKAELAKVEGTLEKQRVRIRDMDGRYLALRKELESVRGRSVAATMLVKDAQFLDYWDGAWKPVVNGVKLPAGTLLRAEGSRTMLRFEQRSLRLVAGFFQVRGKDRLISVPLNPVSPGDEIVASRRGSPSNQEPNREGRIDPIQGIFNRLRD